MIKNGCRIAGYGQEMLDATAQVEGIVYSLSPCYTIHCVLHLMFMVLKSLRAKYIADGSWLIVAIPQAFPFGCK